MRKKMESRSRTRGAPHFDLKLSPGGMADVEFTAQMIMLARREEIPISTRTLDVLKASEGKELTIEETNLLVSAYSLLRHVEAGVRLILEDRGSILPDGHRLDLLARCLGRKSGAQLLAQLTETATDVRRTFTQFCTRLETQER